jgi:hypothetical protein
VISVGKIPAVTKSIHSVQLRAGVLVFDPSRVSTDVGIGEARMRGALWQQQHQSAPGVTAL